MKILKDSLIYLIGELIAKALPFLLLPYLTRKLGAAGFGELSYFQTVCALLIIVFGLSQDGAVTRYFYVYGKRLLPRIMLAGYVYTAFGAALALLFAWWQQSSVIAAVALAAATQTILGVQLAYRQCQKRALSYTTIQITAGISTSLLTVTLLELTESAPVTMRFFALFLGNALVSFFAFLSTKQEFKNAQWFSGSLKTWRLSLCYVLTFGIPLLLHHISGFAKGQFDRILIYQYFPNEQLGIYAAAYQLAAILSILLLALNKATVPYMYQALKQGSLNATRVRHWAVFSLLLAPIPALLAWIIPEPFLLWLLGVQYVGIHKFWVVFTLGFGLTIPYFLLVNFLFYHGQNKRIALISVLSTLIYLAVLFATTASGNLFAIAFAMVAGNLAILPLLYYFVREP